MQGRVQPQFLKKLELEGRLTPRVILELDKYLSSSPTFYLKVGLDTEFGL